MQTKIKRYNSEEIIFSEGDKGDCAYLIESGRIQIFINSDSEKVPLIVLGPGEIFGEMAVIDGSPRSASAVALDPCELLIVSREQIFERIEGSDAIVRLLISILLKRMRKTNESTRQLSGSKKPSPTAPKIPDTLSEQTEITKKQVEIVIEKMKLESDLKNALENSEFELFFQPIMDLATMQIGGFEALIRWKSPSRGMVRPDIFMGIAEETSLIVPIGKWVMEESCRVFAKMRKIIAKQKIIIPDLFMSINISGRQFYDKHFFEDLIAAASTTSIPNNLLKLEVTERVFMEGVAAQHALQKCQDLGFHVSLDDFGTGFSSLSYLAQFPVNTLKIDQSFVRRMMKDERTFTIVKAIINMANDLNLPVVAEGVETENECQSLAKIGCRFGQGYLFAKPLPYDKAAQFLTQDFVLKKAE